MFITKIVPVSSKGQITIPKEAREHLKLNNVGDYVLIEIDTEDEGIIYIEKTDNRCVVCDNSGKLENNECFVCRGNGDIKFMNVMENISDLMKVETKNRYGISISLINQESEYPKIKLYSDNYSNEIIEKAELYFQQQLKKMYIKYKDSDEKIIQGRYEREREY